MHELRTGANIHFIHRPPGSAYNVPAQPATVPLAEEPIRAFSPPIVNITDAELDQRITRALELCQAANFGL